MHRLGNYLRTHRRRWQLTQEELAFIFGYSDPAMVGRLERDERVITLAVAHTTHLMFGVEPRDLFPAFFAGVEDNVFRRMHELRDQFAQDQRTPPIQTKLVLLHEAIHRIAKLSQQSEV